MTSIVKLTSQGVAAACPELSYASRPAGSATAGLPGLAASSLGGIRLRGASLSEARMAGLGLSASAVREVSERPIQAPAAVVAEAHAYAAANGAGHRTQWTDDVKTFFEGRDVVVTKKTQQTKRAFRGLEPWRDPA